MFREPDPQLRFPAIASPRGGDQRKTVTTMRQRGKNAFNSN
jgi:hypothetical protein